MQPRLPIEDLAGEPYVVGKGLTARIIGSP